MNDQEQIEKMESLEKLATPGPWLEDTSPDDDGTGERLYSLGPIDYWASYAEDSSLQIPENDINFIVAAREFIPWAIKRIRKLEAVADAAKGVVEDYSPWAAEGHKKQEIEFLERKLEELGIE